MTDAPPPSFINRAQAVRPEWLARHMVGQPEPNGSFLVRTKLGHARVHPKMMVFEWGDHAYVCDPSEVKALLAELREEAIGMAKLFPAIPAKPVAQTRPVATRKPAAGPGQIKHGAPIGAQPSIEWVLIDQLKVDDSYQRSIDTGPSRALINKMALRWDWRLCVPLMVSRRSDGLYVIDGQHRRAAAGLRTDIFQLPCCISTYSGPADEAAMFVEANRARRAINRLDDFHAAQAGGDKDALAIANLIRSVGFTISRRTGSASWAPGEVAFTSAIAKVRRRHGEELARQALQMMADAFGGQRLSAGSPLFTALSSVLADPPPDFDRDRLMRALRTFNMDGWASFLTESKGGTDRNKHLREMLLEAYADERAAA